MIDARVGPRTVNDNTNPIKETTMTNTHPQNPSEFDRTADFFVTMLTGLELLSLTAATIVDGDSEVREFLTDAIVRAGSRSNGTAENGSNATDEVTAAALVALAGTYDEDLENPLRGWILKCRRLTAIYRRTLGSDDSILMDGLEMQLPYYGRAGRAVLLSGANDFNAELTVSLDSEITSRIVRCPRTIKEAFNIAIDFSDRSSVSKTSVATK